MPSIRPALPETGRVAAGLAIAAAGGYAGDLAGVPLPYMLGAIAATLVAALMRVPMAPPRRLMAPMRACLGVLLGSAVTPELFARLGDLGMALALVPVYCVLATVLGHAYLSRVARMPADESFFAAMPGGIYTIVAFAEEQGIASERISLIHAARLMLAVMVIPPVLLLATGHDVVSATGPSIGIADLAGSDLALLVAAGIVGWLVAQRVRLPGGIIIGPLLASAVLHLSGLSAAQPPYELVVAAQVVLGAAVGTRFIGLAPALVLSTLAYSVGFVLIMFAVTIGAAVTLAGAAATPVVSGILAFAPGGLAEMSLVALALGVDPGYVATLHIARILFVVTVAPFAWRALAARAGGGRGA